MPDGITQENINEVAGIPTVTYEFLFENCNSFLKGLLLPITLLTPAHRILSGTVLITAVPCSNIFNVSPPAIENEFHLLDWHAQHRLFHTFYWVQITALQDTNKTDYLTFLKYALIWSLQCLSLGCILQFSYTTLHENPPLASQIILIFHLLN